MIERKLASLLFVGVLTGCSGIDRASLDGVKGMPDDSTLSNASGELHTGVAVDFTPRVWTSSTFGGEHEETGGIDVRSSNDSVLRVAHVTDDRRVVVWAVAPGQALLTVTFGGDTAMTTRVQVTDQAP